MKFEFKNIPEQTKFICFDYKNNAKSNSITNDISIGDSEFEIDIPDCWEEPYYALRTILYFVPDDYEPLNTSDCCLEITGGDYYLDVTRPETKEEANKKSVETLIRAIARAESLSGRQKFYVALMALNSHFEYVVHAMLVLSGHISEAAFRRLRNHESRIAAAFDANNGDFFAEQIELCPKKTQNLDAVPDATKDRIKSMMNQVRKLRNDVAHKWGYRDLPGEQLRSLFESFDSPLSHHISDEALYEEAASRLTVLWAQTGSLQHLISLISERQTIQDERTARGY